MELTIRAAVPTDAAEIAALRSYVADDLTAKHGEGHWSLHASEKGVLRSIGESAMLAGWVGDVIIATLRLARKKPWAIDVRFFTAVSAPLYLLDMAVHPARQRQGIGRLMLATAKVEAVARAADAIRLDAYDAAAGAGSFYARCGYRHVGNNTYRGNPLQYYELLL